MGVFGSLAVTSREIKGKIGRGRVPSGSYFEEDTAMQNKKAGTEGGPDCNHPAVQIDVSAD
jgi:hypothetical protein